MKKKNKLLISLLVAAFLLTGSGFAMAIGSDALQGLSLGTEEINPVQLLGGNLAEADSAPDQATTDTIQSQQTTRGVQESQGANNSKPQPANRGNQIESLLIHFNNELQQIEHLQTVSLSLRQQEIKNRSQIRSLTLNAITNKNTEELKQIHQLLQSMKPINQVTHSLQQQIIKESKEFRKDVASGDINAARAHINQVINLMTQINVKLQEKLAVYDQIIKALS